MNKLQRNEIKYNNPTYSFIVERSIISLYDSYIPYILISMEYAMNIHRNTVAPPSCETLPFLNHTGMVLLIFPFRVIINSNQKNLIGIP